MNTQSITVDWKWTDYQAEVRNTLEAGEHDLVVFRTGYGGGKSITGAQWIHRGALQLDHGDSLIMGQDFQKAEGTTFKVFWETLPGEETVPDDAGGDPENSPIVAGYNQNKNRVTYITGHKVRLGSADKWNRYAGGEFHRIWCDEVAHYDNTDLYRLHEMLVTRQRTEAGPNTTLWTSTGSGYNQFYDVTERQVGPDDDPLPWADSMKVIVASTEHNTLLPEDGLEKIRNQFQGTAREEQGLHGGFAAAEGLVYGDFSRQTHVVEADDVADRLVEDHAIYGYDAGWVNLATRFQRPMTDNGYGVIKNGPTDSGTADRASGRDSSDSLPGNGGRNRTGLGPYASEQSARDGQNRSGQLVTDGGETVSETTSDSPASLVGYVVSSKYRIVTMLGLHKGSATPSTLAEETNIEIAHISRALKELRERDLVQLLVADDRKKGRLYDLTGEGKSLFDEHADVIERHVASSDGQAWEGSN